ncbi:hypothetical protein L1887_37186 [Cichorium endivia]|nr:hypothetical protein L1887_37186 [Cichorium endivia]
MVSLMHFIDQLPCKIVFEKLSQYINNVIVGFCYVFEPVFGFHPFEELHCAFPDLGDEGAEMTKDTSSSSHVHSLDSKTRSLSLSLALSLDSQPPVTEYFFSG